MENLSSLQMQRMNQAFQNCRLQSHHRLCQGQMYPATNHVRRNQPWLTTSSGWPHCSESTCGEPSSSLALKRNKKIAVGHSTGYDPRPYWKRTIPYVSLGLEPIGKNRLCVDSTMKNVYFIIPKNAISTRAIISEVNPVQVP